MVIVKMPGRVKPAFHRYIGIDYSGAETPDSSLKGLRVYEADREFLPVEVEPPPSPRKYWTGRDIAEWLVEQLSEDLLTLVGIDHGFSFPLRYFEAHHLEPPPHNRQPTELHELFEIHGPWIAAGYRQTFQGLFLVFPAGFYVKVKHTANMILLTMIFPACCCSSLIYKTDNNQDQMYCRIDGVISIPRRKKFHAI
jgi:hypothetical protein